MTPQTPILDAVPVAALPSTQALAALAQRLRLSRPRVHALTSAVAAERTANVLLAIGARPSLTTNPDEVRDFVRGSDALLINLGMMDSQREQAIPAAIQAAKANGRPWVLDPVFAEVSTPRRLLTERLLGEMPAVFKTNAAECHLAEFAPAATVSVTTGPFDIIRLGSRSVRIANGSPLSQSVTAMGCALGGVIAAFLAIEPDAFTATAAALLLYGVAGEVAAETAHGPGSFAVNFLDALAGISPETIQQRAKLS